MAASETTHALSATERSVDDARSAELRAQMVDALVKEGTIVSPDIANAMRATLRERYAPEIDLEEVYDLYSGAVTKTDNQGLAISSLSAPQVHAYMAQQAGISPGMNVLEIGSGGPNAEILARLLTSTGRLTSMDIDHDVVEAAQGPLADAGFGHVQLVTGDGTYGFAANGPYDAILVTAQSAEIHPAWVDQLVEGGRLVVPLQIRGLPRVITFVRAGSTLLGTAARLFGFVPLRGDQPETTTLVNLRGGEVTVRFDDALPIDPAQLTHVLDSPRVEVRSGAFIGRTEPWGDAQMWLATALPGFCSVSIDPEMNTGLITPPGRRTAAMAAVQGPNLAYVTTADNGPDNDVEFVAHAFGPDATELAQIVADQLAVWGRQIRGGAGPTFCAYPIDTPDEELPSASVVDKTYYRVTISWPHTA